MSRSTSSVNELVNSVESLQEAIANANDPTADQVKEWKASLITIYDKLVLIEDNLDNTSPVGIEPPASQPAKTLESDQDEEEIETSKISEAEVEAKIAPEDTKEVEASSDEKQEPTAGIGDAAAENGPSPGLFSSTQAEEGVSAVAEEVPSLNDRFESEAQELAEELKRAPISDLRSVIGVNQRVTFIFELFANDSTAFDAALVHINNAADLDAAILFIEENLQPNYQWEEKEAVVAEFRELVNRRFS